MKRRCGQLLERGCALLRINSNASSAVSLACGQASARRVWPPRLRRCAAPYRDGQLYEDKSAIQSVGFQLEKPGKQRSRTKRWPVYCFEPLDREALNDVPYKEELGPGFCFATTGRGSWYWIAASDQRAKDSSVIFLDYDGGGSQGETVANSLDEFLNWPRLRVK